MRPGELLLIVLVGVVTLLHMVWREQRPRWSLAFYLLVCAVAALHALLEGWRLQMAPVYLAMIPLGILTFGTGRAVGHWLLGAAAIIGVMVGAFASYVYPVFPLPPPSGPYAIGTMNVHMVDRSRRERHIASSDVPREFMIQVWYPAQHVRGTRAWYRDPRMNQWASQHFRLVKTHAFWNLPVADEPRQFGVLLFSPSSGGFRSQNTFEVEELVSQGYVVVGIDHPYSTSRLVFPDGHVVNSVPWINTANRQVYQESNRRVEQMVEDHVADARFALDEMERWNQPGSQNPFSGRLALGKVGVFGHSFGGALAGALCREDPRVAAGINMDGWLFGAAETEGVPKPFFFMLAADAPLSPAQIAALPEDQKIEAERDLVDWQGMEASLGKFGGYQLVVRGSDHGNFSDLTLFSRVISLTGPKPLDPYRVFQIVNAFTLAFFDRHVRDRPAPLLDEGGFPGEVKYREFPIPAKPS